MATASSSTTAPDAQQSITISNSQVNDFQKTGILIWNANVNMHGNDIEGIGPTGSHCAERDADRRIAGHDRRRRGDGNTFGGVGYTAGNLRPRPI